MKNFHPTGNCPVRDVLSRLGDKWSMLVLITLSANGTMRFSDIHKTIADVSQRMLTVTLRTLESDLLALLSSGDFGRYADEKGDMNVCFISNNDITGGNSGSAMFNAKGELLGLAFDGNWEAMSSDIVFEPDLQRCIGVDVRYMLFIMEKYGKAANLIEELKLTR